MKTFIICTSREGNAISNYFFLLARGLNSRGNKVILVVNKPYKETNIDESMTIYSWPSKRPTKFKDFVFFYKLCKTYEPDVTLGQFGSTNVVLIVSWLLNIPNRLIYWHTMFKQIEDDSTRPKIIQKLLKFRKQLIVKNFATNVLTNSNATKQDLMCHFKLPEARLLVLNFLIPDYFKDNSVPTKIERSHALSVVGRLDTSKGHEALINHLPEVFTQYPNMIIYFIGNGKKRSELEKLCNKLKISKHVVFVGAVSLEKVYEYLGNTLIHISASKEEAFGLVNVEALSAGTPIMAAKVGGIVDILDHGKNGLFYDPNIKGSLLEGIKNIIDNDWDKYSEHARLSFLKTYINNDLNRNQQLEKLDSIINN